MSSATVTRDLIVAQTRALKMPGIARVFDSLARQARDAHWPHEEYLHEVLSAEQTSRHESVIRQRLREVVRSFPSNGRVDLVIQKLNPVLNGWCTYFRVGNSNRTFHKVDWAVRSELQLWLRRKHQCPWRAAKKRWGYRFLHERCRLYRMVGKVSHLEGLRRMPPAEGDRRAGCGKSASPV